jgi:hypothetical protein
MFGWMEGIEAEWQDGNRWTVALFMLAWGLVALAVSLLGWALVFKALEAL